LRESIVLRPQRGPRGQFCRVSAGQRHIRALLRHL